MTTPTPTLRTLRKVLRVVDNRADDPAATEVAVSVCADFHLEGVEAGSDRLLSEAGNFVVAVTYPSCQRHVNTSTKRETAPIQPAEVT
jgi:hypothetical protein